MKKLFLIVITTVLLFLIVIVLYFVQYFSPYFQDDQRISTSVTQEHLLIEQNEFAFRFKLNKSCSINSTPMSFIKRHYWMADLVCNGAKIGWLGASSMYEPNQEAVEEEIQRILLLEKIETLERTYIEEVSDSRTDIYVLNKNIDRYFAIILSSEIESQVKTSIIEL